MTRWKQKICLAEQACCLSDHGGDLPLVLLMLQRKIKTSLRLWVKGDAQEGLEQHYAIQA